MKSPPDTDATYAHIGNMGAGVGLPEVALWVLHLHERFDGHGYHDGLAGEAIPLESRVLSAADALEAMTSSRIYRAALSVEDTLRARGQRRHPV